MTFALFKGIQYYPWGGAEDFYGFVTELPVPESIPYEIDWFNALNLETGEILSWEDEQWKVSTLLQHERIKS